MYYSASGQGFVFVMIRRGSFLLFNVLGLRYDWFLLREFIIVISVFIRFFVIKLLSEYFKGRHFLW